MKKKGFALLETLIASTFILSVLIFLYIQFINLKKNYENSFKYNTISGLYTAKEIVDYMSETGYQEAIKELNNKKYVWLDFTMVEGAKYSTLITKSNVKKIMLTRDDVGPLKSVLNTSNISDIDKGLKDFILKINSSSNSGYRIIIEYNDGTYATVIDQNTL